MAPDPLTIPAAGGGIKSPRSSPKTPVPPALRSKQIASPRSLASPRGENGRRTSQPQRGPVSPRDGAGRSRWGQPTPRKKAKVTEQEWMRLRELIVRRFGSLRGAFTAWNTDARREKEKQLDIDELRRGLGMIGISSTMAARVLSTLDVDMSGTVSFDEFTRTLDDTQSPFKVEASTQTEGVWDPLAALRKRSTYLMRNARAACDTLRAEETAVRRALQCRADARSTAASLLRQRHRAMRADEANMRSGLAILEAQERDLLILRLTRWCTRHWGARDLLAMKAEAEALRAEIASMAAVL
eukprot:TRINITY_DN5977_c0_g1_i1.p1 TRINITY_DN5977_c0_g1~~TRINITY_DN5977_c0_g1_i1.p1  ORF type:complete len:326 (+),score=52.64 TRINITY_DN5977_c0_g1_i1:83-979(+)